MPRFNLFYNIPARYLVILSFVGYALLAFSFPLLPNYDRQPVGDIRTFAPSLVSGLLYGVLILLLFALHALLYRQIADKRSPSLQLVLGVAGLLALPLLFMYPINANDVYRYVIRGLISSRYGKSPFEYAPTEFGEDLYPLLAGEWRDATSPYGPIWESIASVVTSVGQGDFLANIIAFKILGLLALLGTGVILWMLFPLRARGTSNSHDRRLAYTVLWLWNPALLLSFVGNAHNDSLMILILLLGWLMVNRGHQSLGFLIVVTAVLVKPIALLAAPVIFISSWRDLENGRSRMIYLLSSVVGGIVLVFLAFLPFGNPASLVSRLLQEASAGASFSPLTLAILLIRGIGWPVPLNVIARAATFVFAFLVGWVLWQTWRGRRTEKGLAVVFWGYIFQALNFRIWYAIWPFPWLLLDGYDGGEHAARRLHAGLWFLVTSQLSVIIYGYLRVAVFGGSQLVAHLIAVPFVFLLPFVLALLTSRGQDMIAGQEQSTAVR